MTYTSGIGSQQNINAITPVEAQPVVPVNASGAATAKYELLGATVGHADETALSSTGDLISQSLEASDARTAKVLSLQFAINAESYKVSSSDVADKIIQSLME